MARCGAESLMMPRRASCSQGDSLFFLLERISLALLVNFCRAGSKPAGHHFIGGRVHGSVIVLGYQASDD